MSTTDRPEKIYVVKENGKYIGEICGAIVIWFYLEYIAKLGNYMPLSWIKAGIGIHDTAYYVKYKEPRYNMSKKEYSEWFGLDENLITDEFLSKICVKVQVNVVPAKLCEIELIDIEDYTNG